MPDTADVIRAICKAITAGDRKAAIATSADYPFEPRIREPRRYSSRQLMQLFRRDGFIDRYSGQRLVFPGALYTLSVVLPEQFPCHPHGKLSETHIAFWELFPTLDHVIAVTRGGTDTENNWVTTSMLRNQAKLHWSLEELGWQLHHPGLLSEWDGLLGWFIAYTEQNPEILENSLVRRWHNIV